MNKSIFFLSIILVAAFLTSSCSSKKTAKKISPANIHFQSNEDLSLTEVLDLAESKGKLVFLDFRADWCLPCKLMEEEVFTEKRIYSFINKNFISYKVDVDKSNGANLRLLFEAKELPTMLFLDTKGRVLERNEGTILQNDLLALGAKALQKLDFLIKTS